MLQEMPPAKPTGTSQGRELRSKPLNEASAPPAMDSQTKLIIQQVSESINAKIDTKFETLMESFSAVNTKIKENTENIHKLDLRLERLEQYSRRCNLRLHGIEYIQNEDPTETITRFINSIMKIKNFTSKDVECCYRLPNNSMFLKLYSYNVKQIIYNSKKLLKGTKILIREDLTPFRLKAVTAAATKYGARNTWTIDGNIRIMKNNVIHKPTIEELEHLILENRSDDKDEYNKNN